MERISSMFFCLSLLIYYILKVFKVRKCIYIKVHMFLGSISVIAMITALFMRIGQDSLLKYIGFTAIMLSIGITGAFMKKNYELCKKLHVIFTIAFFVYLPIAIKFM